MKKFLIWLISLLSFKKFILPLFIRILNIFFTVKTSVRIIRFLAHFAGLFKFLNTLLGLLLFLNMFDFKTFSWENLVKALYTFIGLIKENLIIFYNKFTSGSNEMVQNVIHSEPAEQVVKKLSEFSHSFTNLPHEYDYHPSRYLDHITNHNTATVTSVSSIFDSFLFWLGMILVIFLIGGLFYFDNPVKNCVKNTVKSGYGKDSTGEVVYQESLFSRWIAKPIIPNKPK